MNIQFTDFELSDFRQYDTNRAVRLVADDEGKNFDEILPKPVGYDDWINNDDSISVAKWVSDKKNRTEFDINEIGRRMLKRALFQGSTSGLPMGAGRPRNNLRRALANKAMGNQVGYLRPGTPYPKIGGVPLVAGPGGTIQLAQMAGRPAAYPIPDAGSSQSFSTPAVEHRHHAILSENSRLRRELEELRAREGVVSRLGQASNVDADTSNGERLDYYDRITIRDIYILLILLLEVGLNIMGLTVSDPPIVRPVAKKAFITDEDETMTNN